MKYYKEFMSRQEISGEGHQRLLDLPEGLPKGAKRVPKGYGSGAGAGAASDRPHPGWAWAASIAAALVLVAGFSIWQLSPKAGAPVAENPSSNIPLAPTTTPVQGLVDDDDATHSITHISIANAPEDPDATTFTARDPGLTGKDAVPTVWSVDYPDLTDTPLPVASIALPDGSFQVDLTKGDIQALFWGAEGKPAASQGAADPGDFPFGLYAWAGYDISASAIYDGEGKLWLLVVQGVRGEDSFILKAAPGHLPLTCTAADGGAETEIDGVTVTAWRQEYDRDGDDENEHVCTSEFMVGDVGVRFENTGAGPLKSTADGKEFSGDAILFNELVVTQLVKEGLYLDHIAAQTEDIPAWRTEKFDALAEALREADFAPYLPQEAPEGFGNFSGNLSYQEGTRNWLAARWYKNYDSVEVEVYLPEGKTNPIFEEDIVDVTVPESYDWRLYNGAICDVVPEEYQAAFYKPVFRAEDMSLEVVKARMHTKDTVNDGKLVSTRAACNFYVLHENDVAVGYTCSGVTAEYVWSLVEDTIQ